MAECPPTSPSRESRRFHPAAFFFPGIALRIEAALRLTAGPGARKLREANDILNQMNVAPGVRATFIANARGSIIAALDSGTSAPTKFGDLP